MDEARVRLTLTDLSVRKLQPPERGQRMYRDSTLPGFGVRVSQAVPLFEPCGRSFVPACGSLTRHA